MFVFLRVALAIAGLWLLMTADVLGAALGLLIFLVAALAPTASLIFRRFQLMEEPRSTEQGELAISNGREPEGVPVLTAVESNALLARRMSFWFIAGLSFFMFFFIYLGVRVVFVERKSVSIMELASASGLPTFILALMFMMTVFSLPLGLLLHQFYYSTYWLVSRRVRFSTVDRAYTPLKELSEEYSLDYEKLYGHTLNSPEEAGARVVPAPGWVRFLLGPKTSFILGSGRPLLDNARSNWTLFNTVWQCWLPRDRFPETHQLVDLKEQLFVLLGVGRIGLWLALIVYVMYDLMLYRALLISGRVLVLSVSANLTANWVVFWVLNVVRAHLDEDSINFRYEHLYAVLNETRPKKRRAKLSTGAAP